MLCMNNNLSYGVRRVVMGQLMSVVYQVDGFENIELIEYNSLHNVIILVLP